MLVESLAFFLGWFFAACPDDGDFAVFCFFFVVDGGDFDVALGAVFGFWDVVGEAAESAGFGEVEDVGVVEVEEVGSSFLCGLD